MTDLTDDEAHSGKFAQNIVYFGRALRAAGLPIGPGKILDAVRAVEAAGIQRRDDFYWTLHSVFVNRRDQRELFDQAFHIFWRNPAILERLMSLMLPQTRTGEAEQPPDQETLQRIADAFAPGLDNRDEQEPEQEMIELDATLTFSNREILATKDFESMTADEVALAKRLIAKMRLPIQEVKTRRFIANPRGRRVDMRRTFRASLRSGGDIIPLRHRARQRRHPPLVILCDISGSMSRYSRMLLHFMHAITNDRDRVFTFLFGTRLTNVTRYLRYRDIDLALDKVGQEVQDWEGGTRIGAALHDFNVNWSRRVLAQGAVVLLISDGLDRDAGEGISVEMERLHKSSRRLIWLNPLLRFEGFEPKALGVKAILPHVDEFRPAHNLESLTDLAALLERPAPRAEDRRARWKEDAA